MYDFIKAVIPAQYKSQLLRNGLLEFERTIHHRTGELTSPKEIAEYKGLKFIVYDSGYIEFQGSLHKFKNDGLHNFDDFPLSEVKAVIEEIGQLFNIDFSECRLHNLEIGVNITPPISTKDILNNLLIHRLKKFKDVSLMKGNYKQALHQRYIVKVYDKHAQYNKNFCLSSPILRFELKYIKMSDLNKKGICTVGDLTDQKHFEILKSLLIKEWEQILFYDKTINKSKSLDQYKKKVKRHQWQNAEYWLDLSKQERSKQKKIYKKAIKLYSENVQKQISNLIAQKWDDLTKEVPPVNLQLSPDCVTV